MARAEVKTIRLLPQDWALFTQFRERLQAEQLLGKISNREAFVVAVSSASAALAKGEMPTRPPTDKAA